MTSVVGTPVAASPGKWQLAGDHASRYWEVDCSATATAATADSSDDESFAILSTVRFGALLDGP